MFEPNDGITRAGVKRVADSLLSELVTLRGLFDFISVCDTTNNTPARIDRNELYLDIAIGPTKAVEFTISNSNPTAIWMTGSVKPYFNYYKGRFLPYF